MELSKVDGYNDVALVEKSKEGDRSAFDALWRRYRTQIFWFCHRRLGDLDSAQDLAGMVFERAWASIKNLRQPGAFRGWIFCIAANLSVTIKRSENSRSLTVGLLDASTVPNEADEQLMEEMVDRAFVDTLLETAISVCTPDEVIALFSFYRNGKMSDTAEALGHNCNTLRSHILRGRQKLLAELFTSHFELIGGLDSIKLAYEHSININDTKLKLTAKEAEIFQRRVFNQEINSRDEKIFRTACLKVARWLNLY